MKKPKTLALLTCAVGFTLVVAEASATTINMINNGDFQAGNTGFSTDYNPNVSIGVTEGTYIICDNPYPHNGSATSYFDHTYGNANGLMMAVNGATVPGLMVWGQSVNGLVAGQQYQFSMWVSSWVATSGTGNAVLDILIDGVAKATFYAPSTAGVWEQGSFTWTATSSSSVFGAIFDRETATFPNDFALDDISLELLSGVPAGEDDQGNGRVPDSSLGLFAGLPALLVGLHWIRSPRDRKKSA